MIIAVQLGLPATMLQARLCRLLRQINSDLQPRIIAAAAALSSYLDHDIRLSRDVHFFHHSTSASFPSISMPLTGLRPRAVIRRPNGTLASDLLNMDCALQQQQQ